MTQTLFDKIWNEHSVSRSPGFPDILYIDTHLINKITSPTAFESLRKRGIPVFRPKQTVVKEAAHNPHIPLNETTRFHLDMLSRNCSDFGLEIQDQTSLNYDKGTLALPGQIIICDHPLRDKLGAFGAIVLGISEMQVEQVLATQCLLLQQPKRMKIVVNGKLEKGLGAKDINHFLLSEISAEGANGYFIEYAGETIISLDMEGRMDICNMSKEIGAVGGIIAPDEITFDYITNLGCVRESDFDESLAFWKSLFSDESSVFDEVLEFDAEDIRPGTYGIGILKLMPSLSEAFISEMVSDESQGIIDGYSVTEYILSQLQDIEEYERSKAYKIFNGV